MPGEQFTVGAVGVGPVGTIMAAWLAEAGANVVVADIPARIAQVRESGLQVRWFDRHLGHRVGTVDSVRSLAEVEPDCIFIATKACILKRIMPEVSEAAGAHSLVLSVQNGVGTEDEIARYVPAENVCRMVVNYAGGCAEDGEAHINWFKPPNFLGPFRDREEPRLARLVEMLNSAGLTSEMVDSVTIKKKAFLKTILNSALMPICGVMGLTMKEATDGKATRRLAENLLREGLSVAERLGYDYGEGILEKCFGYLETGGDHHPSMSIDLRNKRPTEIDFINGKILEIGRRFTDLDMSVNRVMVSLVMAREIMNGTRAPDEIPDFVLEK